MKKTLLFIVMISTAACLMAQDSTVTEIVDELEAIGTHQVDIEEGTTLFRSNCGACHTIGGGKLVGPDLKNVSDRLESDWIISFVKSSTAMIESGDEYAVKIFNEYDKAIMVNHPHLTDENILNIIGYIDQMSLPPVAVVDEVKEAVVEAINPEDQAMRMFVFWGATAVMVMIFIAFAISRTRIRNYSK